MTQPAVSREIRTLEAQRGRPLFHRVNRALEPTWAGQELFVAVDEALRLIDAATIRVAGSGRALSVTTTVALASTWLVPRLSRFARLHPEIDLRLVSSNGMIDLEREDVDVAIRYVPSGAATVSRDEPFDYEQFPVCAPPLAREGTRPLRSFEDLSRHVLIEFETLLYGRPWFDWQQWLAAMKLRSVEGAGWLRLSHYDQVIDAAVNGSGVAIGKLPHLSDHLRDGVPVAPPGSQGVARAGAFYVEVSGSAQREVADVFVDWLHVEVEREACAASPRPMRRRRNRAGQGRRV